MKMGGVARVLGVAWGVGAVGCGAPPQGPVQEPVVAVVPQVKPVEVVGAAPVWRVETLMDVVPESAVLVAHVPRPETMLQSLDALMEGALPGMLGAEIARKTGIGAGAAGELVNGFERGVLFVGARGRDPVERDPAICAGVMVKDGGVVEQVLAQPAVRKMAGEKFVLEQGAEGELTYGAWIREARVAVLCNEPKLLMAALGVAEGKASSFKKSPLFKSDRAQGTWLAVDLQGITAGKEGLEAGSQVFVAFPGVAGAPDLEVRFTGYGASFPALGTVLAATNQGAMERLPKGAAGALGVSLQRAPGKTLRDVIDVVARAVGGPGSALVEGLLAGSGVDLETLDRALGGEVAVGMYRDPTSPKEAKGQKAGAPSGSGLPEGMTVLATIAMADEAAQKKVFTALVALSKKEPKQFKAVGNVITEDLGDGREIRVESRKGMVLIGAGARKHVTELAGKIGKETLGASKEFADWRGKVAATGNVLAYGDGMAVVEMLSAGGGNLPANLGRDALTTLLALSLAPNSRGTELSLDGYGGASVLGIAASLGIYGTRRYLAKAKTSEARNTVGAIARSAAAAYEREGLPAAGQPQGVPVHRLCRSATQVPAVVPKGGKYMPATGSGQDFDQGSDDEGWRCLRFSMSQPFYYQYDYRVGGGYKGPARGGPDPGKDGFEVSAEGDLDGDGKTSLFTRTGKVVKGQIVLSPELFVSDEME
ncbi:hypothetical protein [Chondromyces apiculatus]|uniref:Uncharacterized protein n=1 Tax=Chondromyces apiculatus DSM 436 TaxID=1192034 RepID=A0A017SSS5_9BACT|nr:hypothetical protein [Chondromyces apiculatus]EYF00014.1 Hypothetical protein CAP_1626 [Chondromyces apiculatus DSM 436]